MNSALVPSTSFTLEALLINSIQPSLKNVSLVFVVFCAVCYKALTYWLFYPLFRLVFGTLYPAYASYKAVRTKNVKEYVKWMMYWIVFALFTCAETFTDVFLSWFPFYYEIKIILVIWLLSPATKGSSILYRKFVHPTLSSREHEIDEYLTKAKEQSYKQVLDLGSKGVSALMQTAIKGGGGIVNHLRKSYSLSDLSEQPLEQHSSNREEIDAATDGRVLRRRRSPNRAGCSTSAIYFSEVNIRPDTITHIQSAEDISSGYSSGEALFIGQPPKLISRETLVRSGSIGSNRARVTRVTRSTVVPKKSTGSDESDATDSEIFDTNIIFLNDKIQNIDKLQKSGDEKSESSSEGEFLDSVDTLHDDNKPAIDTVSNSGCFACSDVVSQQTVQEINIDEPQNSTQDVVNTDETKQSEVASVVPNQTVRAGKYNKKTAPSPPKSNAESESGDSAIKATLVLTPGVVRKIGSPSSDSRSEIFLPHSPELKRRSNKSSRIKIESSISRLMMLPKKFSSINKDVKNTLAKVDDFKRFSWHNILLHPPDKGETFTKQQSKSDDKLHTLHDNSSLDSSIKVDNSDTTFFVRELSESPGPRRKLERADVDKNMN